MKLTDDDFDMRVVEFDSGVYLNTSMELTEAAELAKQILQDHEDAKKWREIKELEKDPRYETFTITLEEAQKDRQIVKRLEERFKELNNQFLSSPPNPKDFDEDWEWKEKWVRVINELQKILEDKK